MSDDKKTADGTVDSELNDLLDSALEDFDKPPKTVVKDDTKESTDLAESNLLEELESGKAWSEDFIKQTADQLEKSFEKVLQNGEIGSSLQKMAQTVASAIGSTSGTNKDGDIDFQAAIAQALQDLSVTSENLQNATPGISEADLAAMFGQVNLDEGGSDILPLMQGMMQSLISKEVLYPSLKELCDKYPAWLEEKKTSLPAPDLDRYKKQLELMQKVCTELDTEADGDSPEVKKERFNVVLALMQEMQIYGQPPEDLVGEQSSLFQFDAEGNPILPPMPPGVEPPQNCSIM